jgi:glycosyltransferase involved in cell wall biosynthesis
MGGESRAALDVTRYLDAAGEQVTLVATTGPGDDLAHLEDLSTLDIRLFDRAFPQHNFRSPSLRWWLRANVSRYDVVDVHGIFTFAAVEAAWAAAAARVPYVVHPHLQLDPYDLRKHRAAKEVFGRAVVRRLLERAERIVVTSTGEGARLRRFGASCPHAVVPLPVAPPAALGDGAAFRRRHGIPARATVVLFLGRFDKKKGLDLLIPALARVRADVPDVWFLLCGSGTPEEVAATERLLDASEARSWTTLAGFVSGSDKQDAFAASDLFALPSRAENFGIAVVEALHAGLAVLVSTGVDIHETITSGRVGLVCQLSTDDCAAALRMLAGDQVMRREMARRAPETARRSFGPDEATAALVQLYSEVVTGAALTPRR